MVDVEAEARKLGAQLTRIILEVGMLPEDDAEAVTAPLTGEAVPLPVYDSLLDMVWPEVDPELASERLRPYVEQFNQLRQWCREIVGVRWREAQKRKAGKA